MINAIIRRILIDRKVPKEGIRSAVDTLMTEHEREILQYRLPWTQQEVADKFGMTRERVRTTEAKFFDKIRAEVFRK